MCLIFENPGSPLCGSFTVWSTGCWLVKRVFHPCGKPAPCSHRSGHTTFKKDLLQLTKKVLAIFIQIGKIGKMKSDDEKSKHSTPSKRVPVAEKEQGNVCRSKSLSCT